MKLIPLTQGLFAQVDDEDYDFLMQWKWFTQKDHNTFYAVRNEKISVDKHKRIFMHRVIMNTLDNQITDHKDHNGLNNQKENMRNCTKSQNSQNREKEKGCSSKHKGTYWKISAQKWVAQISFNKKRICLGRFDSEDLAALAYNKAAKELFGNFANPNKVLRKVK